ncbi:MAG: peptidoglycan DD-metalloendopeptidase family protein [Deltaproteobacteria bacterium]|nr:peptidoglycan DD-metalloendopeptidase family protein [Deltaproteobacteria bacterium]MBW2123292.1 peptidoglycan DD-metalloendopeptidase family protein [Deltaproteobacteria bacterium]
MAGDHLTILVFSKNSSNVRRYRVPRLLFRALAVVLPLLVGMTVLLGLNFLRSPRHASLIAQLQEGNKARREEIRFFSERIAELQNQIAQMEEYDSKLRVIANLENRPSSLFGVGGPLLEDLRARMSRRGGLETSQGRPDAGPSASTSQTQVPQKGVHRSAALVHKGRRASPYVPSIWPTRGWITGDFGCRISPLTGQLEMHQGLEISNSLHTPVVASASGLVTTVGTDPDHGKMVVLSHGHGIITRYGHLDEVEVKIGQNVRRGEVIGKMGTTGRCTGPQLYYEVRVNGIPLDPRDFLCN